MRILNLLLLQMLFVFSSCHKCGCTDKQALNYNPKASCGDFADCKFFASSFYGSYYGPDTDSFKIEDTFWVHNYSFTFTIAGISINSVVIQTPSESPLTCEMDSNPVIFNNNTEAELNHIINGYLNLKNDTLYYYLTFALATNDSVFQISRGYGVKTKQ